MPWRHAALMPAVQHGMGGDQRAVLEDADLVGQRMHLHGAPAGGIGDAVEIAFDAPHAVAGDAPLMTFPRLGGHLG